MWHITSGRELVNDALNDAHYDAQDLGTVIGTIAATLTSAVLETQDRDRRDLQHPQWGQASTIRVVDRHRSDRGQGQAVVDSDVAKMMNMMNQFEAEPESDNPDSGTP